MTPNPGAGGRDAAEMTIPGELARQVRLVILDVDGVLSDGGIYIWADAEGVRHEAKRFDAQDGLGIKLLMAAGIEVVIVSGRHSDATRMRAEELGISECHQDPKARKLPLVTEILSRRGFQWAEVAMLGDDLADMPVLRKVGLPVTVANGVPEVRDIAAVTTTLPGGRGAVREFARALLRARGRWDTLLQEYYDARS
jgi:3-deoxy-D-manno-octulosonate 8-phosphate phosphatase (KDO 8-P phosphatase)